MEAIDPLSVELACNDDGCVLIPDDGIAENDILVSDLKADGGIENVAIPNVNTAIPSLDNLDVGVVPQVNPTPTIKNVIPLNEPT